jgi:hypothetical protein
MYLDTLRGRGGCTCSALSMKGMENICTSRDGSRKRGSRIESQSHDCSCTTLEQDHILHGATAGAGFKAPALERAPVRKQSEKAHVKLDFEIMFQKLGADLCDSLL